MGGQALERAVLGPRGLVGDRTWAVRELDRDSLGSARTLPDVLRVRATYADDGRGVRLVLPDGTETSSADPEVHRLLSELVGCRVRLEALEAQTGTSAHRAPMRSLGALRQEFGLAPDEPLPDLTGVPVRTLLRAARYATPPGSFVDVAAVHLLGTRAVAAVGAEARRFRPTVLVETLDGARGEQSWVGREIEVGGARLQVTMPTVRCSIPTREQVDLPADAEVMRRVSRDHGRVLGVYADVLEAGPVRLDDEVVLRDAAPRPRAQRAAARVRDGAYGLARRIPLGSRRSE